MNLLVLLVVALCCKSSAAFVATPRSSSRMRASFLQQALNENSEDSIALDRRKMLLKAAASALFLVSAAPKPSYAASSYVPGTKWFTGKSPSVPGQKARDKNDTKGTRKDGSFLRSISDCKNQCESSNGADGLARSKEDCLSECQDICCDSYEQCTFAIVPRI